MKPLTIILIILLTSCQKKPQITTNQIITIIDNTKTSPVISTETPMQKTTQEPEKESHSDSIIRATKAKYGEDFDGYQRALRQHILNQKKDNYLKKSILQEFYIRGMLIATSDSIQIELPFDLHGFDCGAPDGYTTWVRFSLPRKKERVVFPKKLPFEEEQTGFEEYHFKDTYELVEATMKHVIYHCPKHKRTLVLFYDRRASGFNTNAFYFVEVNRKQLNGRNIYRVVEEYNHRKNENEQIFPYTCTKLNTTEYESFID